MTDLTTATEAAARAWAERSRDDTGAPYRWEDLNAIDKHTVRQIVLPIVVAVAEVIACPDVDAHVGGEDS